MENYLSDPEREIWDAYTQSKKTCKAWHKRIKNYRRWYDFDHYKNRKAAQPGESRYQDPTPTNIVDAAIGVILANEIDWIALPWSPAQAAEETCSQIEKYLAGTVEVNNDREELYIPFEILMHFIRDGAACMYSVWDPKLADLYRFDTIIPDEEAGSRPVGGYQETPIILQVFDPLKITMVPGGPNRWAYVFRSEQMSVADVENRFNCKLSGYEHLGTDAQRRSQKGALVDAWRIISKVVKVEREGEEPERKEKYVVQQCLLFEARPVSGWKLRDMPEYSDIPYSIGFFKPVDRNDPKNWGHGILEPALTTLIAIENAFNRRARQITIFSSMPLQSKTQDGRTIHIDAALGEILPMRQDESIEFSKWPGNPPDVDKHIEYLWRREQQASFHDVTSAAGQGISGYAMSQLADLNRVRLSQPVKHLELLWSRWARKIIRLSERFASGEVVRVYGRMKGKDFAEQVLNDDFGDYMVKAALDPKWPGDEVRRTALAVQVRGILPEKTIIEDYLDYDQPDDILDLKRREMAMMHPAAQMYAAIGALKDLADEGDEAAAMALQMMQEQGGPGMGPGAGRPTEPNAPPAPLGGPSPTMQPTSQEQGGKPAGQGIKGIINKLLGTAPKLGGEM